ncbi:MULTISPECIES: DUF4913 domain-containing protein [Nocardia]|uniref:DUF4913 domain-containing protein n=1 Tax=Nocardia TaxID=1817 RepID=UPI0024540CF8|nr:MULTISPECIES: DUF4913 domain-containing protein [Nocardia]
MSETTHHDSNDAGAAEAAVVPQMDLPELLETAVQKAVTAEIAAKAKEIAADVVAAMLTPEVLAGMREAAAIETAIALDPGPEILPPAADGDTVMVEEPAEDEDEKPRQLFSTVEEFVEGWVANLYRRDVTTRNSLAAWCPRWWEHGEVYARMKTVHRAFEATRTGKGVESSLFWISHLDAHMRVILDPEGPFKYCSAAHGHHRNGESLPVLPTVKPPITSDDPDYAENSYSGARPSRLVLPTAGPGTRRTIIWDSRE